MSEPVTTVFLDRDGTINREKHYLSDPDELELLAGAAAGLRALKQFGCRLVIVTNQSAIARGYFDEQRLLNIHTRLREMLRAEGVEIDGWYWCPHHPDDQCECRKPNTGMLEHARQDLDLDMQCAWMIGDKLGDMETGRRAGLRTILVATGYGKRHYEMDGCQELVDFFVPSLLEAAGVIRQGLKPPPGR